MNFEDVFLEANINKNFLNSYLKDDLLLFAVCKHFLIEKTKLNSYLYELSLDEILALIFNNFCKNGFFVEAGCGPSNASLTFNLEKKVGWNGILVEPNNYLLADISKERKSLVVNKCLHELDKLNLDFFINELEVQKSSLNPTLMTNFKLLKVNTTTLNTLFANYNVPKILNFFILDTEGNEYSILKNFNFKQYQINFLKIEHNGILKNYNDIDYLMKKNYFINLLAYFNKTWPTYFGDSYYIHQNIFETITKNKNLNKINYF